GREFRAAAARGAARSEAPRRDRRTRRTAARASGARRRGGACRTGASRMSVDVESIRAALAQDRVYDSGRLKSGGKHELESALERWQRDHSLRAYVVVLPPDEDLEPARALWQKLGLDSKRDLLLIANGRRWEARGFGLTGAQIESALARAAPDLHE